MRWPRIAGKDLLEARREYHLHLGVGLFLLLYGIVGYLTGRSGPAGIIRPGGYVHMLGLLAGVLVPLYAVGISHEVIVEKRRRGDLKVMLTMPFSRADVVLGSLAGRTALVWLAVGIGGVALFLGALAGGSVVPPVALLAYLVLTALLGTCFVGLGVAASAASRSRWTVTGGAFLVLVLFSFRLWGALPLTLMALSPELGRALGVPDWQDLFANLNPVEAYMNGLHALVPPGGGVPGVGRSLTAWYQALPVAMTVLFAWFAGAVLLGYWQFREADL